MTNELRKKVNQSIRLIQAAGFAAKAKKQPLEICYSGGKDSDIILELSKMSGVEYRAIYKNTTIDPPGTLKHARDNGVEVVMPTMNFKQIIEKKGLPSRNRRHCCEYLKEYKIYDYAVIGVRNDESRTRAEYKEPSVCRVYKKGSEAELFMPLLEWTAADVEEFITEHGIKCHPLYYDEQGRFHVKRRLGCIGCPLAYYKHRLEEFKRYPGMVRLYIKAAQKFLNNHPNSSMLNYIKDAVEWFIFSLHCNSIEDWNQRFKSKDLFSERFDCHAYIQREFGIDI